MDMLSIYRCNLRLQALYTTLIDIDEERPGEEEEQAAGGQEYPSTLQLNLIKPLFAVLSSLSKFNALIENIVDVDRLRKKDSVLGTKWVQVRPSLTPNLFELYKGLEETVSKMNQEKAAAFKLLNLDKKAVLHIENNDLRGHHFRITKKTYGSVKNMGKLVKVLTTLHRSL